MCARCAATQTRAAASCKSWPRWQPTFEEGEGRARPLVVAGRRGSTVSVASFQPQACSSTRTSTLTAVAATVRTACTVAAAALAATAFAAAAPAATAITPAALALATTASAIGAALPAAVAAAVAAVA